MGPRRGRGNGLANAGVEGRCPGDGASRPAPAPPAAAHIRRHGLTTEAAVQERLPFQPDRYADRWAPVLIRFTDATQVPILAGDVAGVASPVRAPNPTTGIEHFVSGAVYLDVDILGQDSPDGSPAYLTVLRHELGHLVGLGHVDDPTQLMNPSTKAVTTFQPGDLTGLAALGNGPCAPGL